MAKQIKAAVIAAVVVFIVYSTLGVTSTAILIGDLSVAMSAAVLTFTTTLVAGVIGKMTSKGVNATAGNFGNKFTARSAIEPRKLIYGQCRVGGTFVHMETSGVDNFLLHMVVAIAGHEIEDLESIRLNDKNLSVSSSTISGSTVYTCTDADYTNTENENDFGSGRLLRYSFQDGGQTAVDGFMNAQLNSMGTSDKFLGVSYVYIQMVFDAEKFGGGMPSVSFNVKGKKCFDPRNNSTAFTSNPALHVRDFLSNTQYGLKAKNAELNDTTNAGGFASAANICDQNVTLADGSTTEKRYRANGFTNFSGTGAGIIEGLLSSMAGRMSYVNGQFCVFAGASQTPSLTITDDELISPVNVSTNPNAGNLFNSIKPIYVDASQGFTATDAEVYQDSTFLNADTPSGESTANYVKQMETQLPFTVTDTMAQRLGRIALKSQRQTTSITVLVSLQFMRCQPNDWVYFTNERLGYSQKVFEVISTNLEVTTSADVPIMATRLELKEVSGSVFNFATSDYTTGQSEGSDVTIGSYSVTAPSNLALAQQTNKEGVTTKVDIKASWTNNSSDKVTLTEVAYKLSTDSAFTSDFTVGKGVAVALLPSVVVGKQYNVKARHIDVNGVASAYTSVVTITIAAPTDAPQVPQSLSASSGKPFNILVKWTNSSQADLKAVKIYRRTANTNPTDDTHLVETIAGANGKITSTLFGTQDGLTAGTTYYFWARAVNHSDVHSAFTSSVSGNFTNVSAAEIVDGSITAVKIAARAVENSKIAVNAIQGDVIAAGAIVEAKLGTDAVTNAKLANNAVDTAQIAADAVETAKIADNAVTNALIATDAVNQDSLAANSVTANAIVAGTITASEIATNAITAAKINAGAIVAGKIAANAIIAEKIAANAITANKISANAITADKIAANAVVAAKISAGAIVAGKLAADSIVATNIQANAITAAKINADAVTADKVAANAIVAANIVGGTITATQMAADSIGADQIVANAVTADAIASGTITATEIASGTITGTQINVDTLAVKKFANVSSTIISHTGSAVPLEVFGSVFQRASNNFSTQTTSTGTYLALAIGSVRNDAKYRAILSGVYGDCSGGFLEYSINGSSYAQAQGGIQSIAFGAGTFRTYVIVYSGSISGMSSSQSTVSWRLRWTSQLRSTYQSLYVFIDNTQ